MHFLHPLTCHERPNDALFPFASLSAPHINCARHFPWESFCTSVCLLPVYLHLNCVSSSVEASFLHNLIRMFIARSLLAICIIRSIYNATFCLELVGFGDSSTDMASDVNRVEMDKVVRNRRLPSASFPSLSASTSSPLKLS